MRFVPAVQSNEKPSDNSELPDGLKPDSESDNEPSGDQ